MIIRKKILCFYNTTKYFYRLSEHFNLKALMHSTILFSNTFKFELKPEFISSKISDSFKPQETYSKCDPCDRKSFNRSIKTVTDWWFFIEVFMAELFIYFGNMFITMGLLICFKINIFIIDIVFIHSWIYILFYKNKPYKNTRL